MVRSENNRYPNNFLIRINNYKYAYIDWKINKLLLSNNLTNLCNYVNLPEMEIYETSELDIIIRNDYLEIIGELKSRVTKINEKFLKKMLTWFKKDVKYKNKWLRTSIDPLPIMMILTQDWDLIYLPND